MRDVLGCVGLRWIVLDISLSAPLSMLLSLLPLIFRGLLFVHPPLCFALRALSVLSPFVPGTHAAGRRELRRPRPNRMPGV